MAQLPVAHAHYILPDMVTSGHVTSGCSPLLPLKYDFVRAHILLVLMQNSTPRTKGKFYDALSVNIPNKE
jgi:hypothetical protein